MVNYFLMECLQGSVIGPLLFNIYSSDILQFILNGSYHMYASDLHRYYYADSKDKDQVTELINQGL